MDAHPLSFLRARASVLYGTYVQAERLVGEDPSAACVKLRIFAEEVAEIACSREQLPPRSSLAERLADLRRRGVSPEAVRRLNELRLCGNRGAHQSAQMTISTALRALADAHAVAAWLAQTYLGVAAADVPIFAAPAPTASMNVFRDAILEGDADAQCQVGMILLHRADLRLRADLRENGVAFHDAFHDAVKWLRRAAPRSPTARAQFARLIWRGIVPARYPEEPVELLESAAESGDPDAHAALGGARMLGLHELAVDYEAARMHFEVAASHDHLDALNGLVKVYADGLGTPADSRQALGYARRAAEAGYDMAQYNLALLLTIHAPASRERDVEIIGWLTKAAEGGFAPAMHDLYRAYRDGNGVSRDGEQADRWRAAALAENEARTCFDMGVMFESGDGVLSNALTALRFYEKAALYASLEQAQFAQEAKIKVREMVLRNRAELGAKPVGMPESELNDRIFVELGTDDAGDPVPGFGEALAKALVDNAGRSPGDIVMSVVGVNPSAAKRLGLALRADQTGS